MRRKLMVLLAILGLMTALQISAPMGALHPRAAHAISFDSGDWLIMTDGLGTVWHVQQWGYDFNGNWVNGAWWDTPNYGNYIGYWGAPSPGVETEYYDYFWNHIGGNVEYPQPSSLGRWCFNDARGGGGYAC